MTGDGCSINLCGWGNNELQWYLPENATVSGGTLKITAQRHPDGKRRYTSARLRTKHKGDWTYGRFEARIRLPRGQGLWPAFWMLPTDEVYGIWPLSGEIDILEVRGHAPEVILGTIHFGELYPNHRSSGARLLVRGSDPSAQFHRYAVEWEPEEIRWYFDDFLFARKTRDDLEGHPWPFDQRFHLLLNLAVGGRFVGHPDPEVFPGLLEVDYVRVYEGPLPTLRGPVSLPAGAAGVVFALDHAPEEGSFAWTAPQGATIVSGQGTKSITVNWGARSGTVHVRRSNPCGKLSLHLPVFVEAEK